MVTRWLRTLGSPRFRRQNAFLRVLTASRRCEEERRKLVERIGTSHPVPPDKTDWVRCGDDHGYFQPRGLGGALVLVLPGPKKS